MNKKLKIQFWRAEKALAMQILEQKGLPKEKRDGYVKIKDSPALILEVGVCLRGCRCYTDFRLDSIYFTSNSVRDAYLDKVINAITDELFTGEGELKVGEMCEASDDGERWTNRRLLAALPKKYDMRYITTGNGLVDHFSWRYARPLTKRTEPIVEECGNVVTYTWEEK